MADVVLGLGGLRRDFVGDRIPIGAIIKCHGILLLPSSIYMRFSSFQWVGCLLECQLHREWWLETIIIFAYYVQVPFIGMCTVSLFRSLTILCSLCVPVPDVLLMNSLISNDTNLSPHKLDALLLVLVVRCRLITVCIITTLKFLIRWHFGVVFFWMCDS